MWYEVLKIIVLVLGPVLIYSALRITFQVPELITALPTAGRRVIEAVGALFIVGPGLWPMSSPSAARWP
jgi:hypothetical protein